ncbi:cryptochrome/photolyase family protein [Aliidiomarina sanyensis]|uniref:Cryptochrome/photolyase family protein n=1 Tax=Aliidiomarina sanyensis TaxID=1249555 RepID=A0A432WAJ5_9GAMM|nr:cryptochrome/photolyase family protein [Aliidiomarina sanyensis]RUO27438.1 cryptochrome/photolyase family protein [Aliidiomarina sanyensis]
MTLYLHTSQLPRARKEFREVRLILGDQLNASHSWFKEEDTEHVLFVLFEMRQETDYVTHHRQKVLAFFAAMRAFADAMGTIHNVLYMRLDSDENQHNLKENIHAVLNHVNAKKFSYQEPDEYRLDIQLNSLDLDPEISIACVSSEHFFTQRDDLIRYFPKLDRRAKAESLAQTQTLLMETFYRQIRKETGYLMEGNKPEGGKWNYDQENRNKLPDSQTLPDPLIFANDVRHIEAVLNKAEIKTLGTANSERLLWPISRRQSRELLRHFVQKALPHFGVYQDAMSERCWTLFHSRLSFSLNTKMLHPREVIEAAIQGFRDNPNDISIAQVEGFVRQILGWREYVRMIYWQFMPDYKATNYFEHKRDLPAFFWTGKTKMRCLQHSIQQSLDYAYAHHIQRLMVTGNFALLAGIAPEQVNTWYLGIYIDAVEWVELPNTHGMSQFADGGLLASKPYVSSGNYLQKMGHYCTSCEYDVKQKTGPKSCPLNSLYWHFIDRNLKHFKNNHRMHMIVNQWEKRSDSDRKAVLEQADTWLLNLENI